MFDFLYTYYITYADQQKFINPRKVYLTILVHISDQHLTLSYLTYIKINQYKFIYIIGLVLCFKWIKPGIDKIGQKRRPIEKRLAFKWL